MITSEEIVNTWGAKLTGQLLLWDDYDYILRKTKFQNNGNKDFEKKVIVHCLMSVMNPNAGGDEQVSLNILDSYRDAVKKYFKYTTHGHFDSKINQFVVKFLGYKGMPYIDQCAELEEWLPYIKEQPLNLDSPYKNKEHKEVILNPKGSLVLGNYRLVIIEGEKKYLITKTRFQKTTILGTFNELLEAVTYIVDYLPYE